MVFVVLLLVTTIEKIILFFTPLGFNKTLKITKTAVIQNPLKLTIGVLFCMIDQRQNIFQRYISLNGVSIAFLMNDLLILYGIRNGLEDPQIAVLTSFMYLTMPFMVLGKRLIPRYGLSKT
ncbi:MAG: hypothetical protein K9L66_09130 [Spirochaetaceae bacterium]|nr:hypothetical protein [Spirochaetaceae bacterium]MCF7951678.1 hypothetical protein [Spirochaetaceae bacterium]